MALNYLDKAAWDAGVYKDKGNDDDTQQDTSSEDSGYSASGILSAAKNFLEHPSPPRRQRVLGYPGYTCCQWAVRGTRRRKRP